MITRALGMAVVTALCSFTVTTFLVVLLYGFGIIR